MYCSNLTLPNAYLSALLKDSIFIDIISIHIWELCKHNMCTVEYVWKSQEPWLCLQCNGSHLQHAVWVQTSYITYVHHNSYGICAPSQLCCYFPHTYFHIQWSKLNCKWQKFFIKFSNTKNFIEICSSGSQLLDA